MAAPSIKLDASLSGTRALLDQFEQLDKRTAVSGLKKVARKSGNVFLKEVRREAPRETGQLAKSLKLNVKVLPRIGEVSALSRPVSNKNSETGRNPVHYNHLVARGTKPHVISARVLAFGSTVVRSVQHPGAKANPYVDRATDRKKDEALQTVVTEMQNELKRIRTLTSTRESLRELF